MSYGPIVQLMSTNETPNDAASCAAASPRSAVSLKVAAPFSVQLMRLTYLAIDSSSIG
jgi:hypothetical protein